MLQFIAQESVKYSIAEEVQMALEGGCRWIQLRMTGATPEVVRETALELIPMCKETEAFLIIESYVDVVADLKVSGVHLNIDDMDPLQARDILGAHAIIGFTANNAEDILKYKGKDIDYASISHKQQTENQIIEKVRSAEIDMPLVITGNISVDNIDAIIATGANGIAMSEAIINAPDPMLYTADVINRLSKI